MSENMMRERLMNLSLEYGMINPGCARALREILSSYGEPAIALIESSGITGSEIWILYSTVCDKEKEKMWQALNSGQAINLLKGCRSSRFYERSHSK